MPSTASTVGFNPPAPPFVGVLGIVGSPSAIGVWRPTPLVNAPGAGPQFATMTPWTMRRPSQFRPAPPPALTSAAYTMDYNEIKIMHYFRLNNNLLLIDDTNLRRTRFASGPDAES